MSSLAYDLNALSLGLIRFEQFMKTANMNTYALPLGLSMKQKNLSSVRPRLFTKYFEKYYLPSKYIMSH